MRTNTKTKRDRRLDETTRLAGGYGAYAAKQDAEALLRRSVMACLLWEDVAYENGERVANNIANLIPQVEPKKVFDIAVEARTKQKLRHTPLYIAREMARHDSHKGLVGELLPLIILRADELAEFLALYWKDNPNQPISAQVKKGLAAAFNNFDEYQLAKWNKDRDITLRDVMFLVHPKPRKRECYASAFYRVDPIEKDNYQRGSVVRHIGSLLDKLTNNSLPTPDTWENELSNNPDKKAAWTRLIEENRLGALAFIRNLRNMEKAKVSPSVIRKGFKQINPKWLLPVNYFAAAKHAPNWTREIEELMFRGLSQMPKLPGYTIFVVDVSGSMSRSMSYKSEFSRLDAAVAMAIIASEVCEHISIYATGGDDWKRVHKTKKVRPHRGFALSGEIKSDRLGAGGIFTRQCLEYIRSQEVETPDRIIVFSDSQDCDYADRRLPQPFGKNNYIIDISSNTHGINYEGVWTAEISGWSEHFLNYIMAYEGLALSDVEEY